MTYTKTVWENRVSPRINATNMNKIETGIYEAHNDISTLNAALVTDLISGMTPTFVDWTVDPTDAADITDGDVSTVCTTGSAAIAAYAQVIVNYDLGALYDVHCAALGKCVATAGTPRMYIYGLSGAAWVQMSDISGSTSDVVITGSGRFSQVRLVFTATANGTISPNVRSFNAWRLYNG